VQDEITAYLEARREVNFVVNSIDPAYTTIDVVAEVVILPGFDSATVLDMVEAALNDYLDPANWGRAQSGDGRFSRPWINTTTVAYLNIARTILMVEGVAFISPGTLTVEGAALDVDLSGDPAPLTRPGTMTITAA
jgi:hypothetical protein